jgi:hypothetical protein
MSDFTLTDEEKQLAVAFPGRINAIKSIRLRTGLGLRDAKDLLDRLAPRDPVSAKELLDQLATRDPVMDSSMTFHAVENYVVELRTERDHYRAALEAIASLPPVDNHRLRAARLAQDALAARHRAAFERRR